MRKIIVLCMVIALLMLSACTNGSADNSDPNDMTTNQETVNEEDLVETFEAPETVVQSSDKETDVDEASSAASDEEIQNCINQMKSLSNDVSFELSKISDMMGACDGSQEWIDEFFEQVSATDDLIRQAQGITPPKELEDIYSSYSKAMSSYQAGVLTLAQGVANDDAASVDEASTYMDDGEFYMFEATDKLDEYMNQ